MSIADPRDITPTTVGTPLRDAAVNPDGDDFLPPTNAGEEGELGNPHGPTVVSPEIHGSQGTRPVRPGDVPGDAGEQSEGELEHTADWHPGAVPPEDPEPDPPEGD